ncbi:MAG: glycosyltransferase family 2 protein [Patescibacteria group bacterium]
MERHLTVAAVVAAYNEEPTIGPVIRTLVDSKQFRDVIVVSDGSVDRTATVARENGASFVYEFQVNRGKGAAMQYGVEHTDADIIFFCDADLKGLTAKHVKDILAPVLDGKMTMVVGLRDRGKWMLWLERYLPLEGGERALLRRVVDDIPDAYMRGYMVEPALNYYCRSRKLPYGTVDMPGLSIRRKMQKVGVWKGLKGYVKMTTEIIRAMVAVRIARIQGKF